MDLQRASTIAKFVFSGVSICLLSNCAVSADVEVSRLTENNSPESAAVSPYQLERFRPVMDESKLQAPDSSEFCSSSAMHNCAGWFFKLDASGEFMSFSMSGDRHRSELRQLTEWRTSSASWLKMIGEVFLPPPDLEMQQFTFAQIHDSGEFPNKPLLRLAWRRSRQNLEDHLWVVLRLSPTDESTTWSDLGARSDGLQKFEIKVRNNHLIVKLDDQAKFEADVDYWQTFDSYFKVGVYLQSDGWADAKFRSLRYYRE
jgi:hypothetical protein